MNTQSNMNREEDRESGPLFIAPTDNRCPHSRMWGDRTDVLGRDGVPLCDLCARELFDSPLLREYLTRLRV